MTDKSNFNFFAALNSGVFSIQVMTVGSSIFFSLFGILHYILNSLHLKLQSLESKLNFLEQAHISQLEKLTKIENYLLYQTKASASSAAMTNSNSLVDLVINFGAIFVFIIAFGAISYQIGEIQNKSINSFNHQNNLMEERITTSFNTSSTGFKDILISNLDILQEQLSNLINDNFENTIKLFRLNTLGPFPNNQPAEKILEHINNIFFT